MGVWKSLICISYYYYISTSFYLFMYLFFTDLKTLGPFSYFTVSFPSNFFRSKASLILNFIYIFKNRTVHYIQCNDYYLKSEHILIVGSIDMVKILIFLLSLLKNHLFFVIASPTPCYFIDSKTQNLTQKNLLLPLPMLIPHITH